MSADLTPEALGFHATADGWQRQVGVRAITFRVVRTRQDFAQCERLQRDVFGVSETDLASFSIMVVIPKTGGEVIGAFDGERMVGYIQGYGGYVEGRPLLLSDLMAVDPAWRGGLGFALKTLQAVLAVRVGFREAAWTVDPLRAANARLNFERLGATSHVYEENVYGEEFAGGLYGGLPSDRLYIHWDLTSVRVRDRLLGAYQPLESDAALDLPDFPTTSIQTRVALPTDIDTLLANDPDAAREWRFTVRQQLETAFADGFSIVGFAGSRAALNAYYVLERQPRSQ